MATDRRTRILTALSAASGGASRSAGLCAVARDVVGLSGAGVMLMAGAAPGGSLCTTNDVSRLIEELQYTLGEGPCVDAYRDTDVVLEPDLAVPSVPRWPAFTPPAVDAGVRAVFAFPLLVGGIRLGAMDLYRDVPGGLSDDQHADALVMADVAAHWVLEVQADAEPDTVAEDLVRDADFHFVVHNAAGAVSVQLDISVADALVWLRAYAFTHGRPLRDVAEDVVARRLRF